jgi:hypothetical protein
MLNSKYVSIDFILDKLYRDFGFENINRYDVAEWLWEVIGLLGIAYTYEPKSVENITVSNWRFEIPVDFMDFGTTGGIRDRLTQCPLKYATDLFQTIDNFTSDTTTTRFEGPTVVVNPDGTNNPNDTVFVVINTALFNAQQYTYKPTNGFFYCGFKEGNVDITYNAFPIDENSMPKVPDEVKYIRAVCNFIAWKIAFKLKLRNQIAADDFNKIEIEYLHSAGAARTKAILPDIHLMESIKDMSMRLIPLYNQYRAGFRYLNEEERLRAIDRKSVV